MKKINIILALAIITLSGCNIFPKKEEDKGEEKIEKPLIPSYGPVQTNVPETTESYWATGVKPKKLKVFLNKENSFVYFYDLDTGKQAGFSQVSLFSIPTDGHYSGKQVEGDTIEFASTAGRVTFSSTNTQAEIYIPAIGFAILKSYVETNTPLVVMSDKPIAPVAYPVYNNVLPTKKAEVSNPFTRSRDAIAEEKNALNEPIADGIVADLIPQLEAMQKGPTKFGVE